MAMNISADFSIIKQIIINIGKDSKNLMNIISFLFDTGKLMNNKEHYSSIHII